MNAKLYNVGVYIRLSVENTLTDSESIENQREMLSKFISHMPCWVEKRVFIDNGASGGNFNRKGFQDMMADVRNGEINLVLVQDLSRFGRNYLEAGKYLEEELPSLGCRFVSVMDGIDTETGENDIMPLLNAMHDLHLKSLSERVSSVLRAKAQAGHKLGRAPYGYRKDPADRTKLYVDDYSAGVVRRIYDMRLQGVGYTSIVKALNIDGIIPPLVYYYRQNGMDDSQLRCRTWLSAAVKAILANEAYIGNAVQLVNQNPTYRNRKQIKRPSEEWARAENVYPAIVERNVWKTVQELNRKAAEPSLTRRKPQKSLFSGMLLCAGCGRTMVYKPAYYTDTSTRKKSCPNYMCRSYHNSGGTVCTRHSIGESKLKMLVLTQIREMSEQIIVDEQSVLSLLQTRLIGERASTSMEAENERKSLARQLQKLEITASRLYEERVTGVITEEDFVDAVEKNETERQQKSQRLALLEQSEQEISVKLSDIHHWMRLIGESAAIEEVDRDLLDALVDHLEIGDNMVENGVKTQVVQIYFKFVSCLE